MSTTYQIACDYKELPFNDSTLNFLYINIRSLVKRGKLDELQCIIETVNGTIHFILLTETWIKNDFEAKYLKLRNYSHYYNYRTDKIGGGVSIFAHDSIKHELTQEKYIGGNNFLWLHVDRLCLDVAVLYKPGYTSIDEFLCIYEAQLEKSRRAIIFGDFNLDMLHHDGNVTKYIAMLSGTEYHLINNIKDDHYTRIDKGQRRSILDHVCSNLHDNKFHMSIIDSPMSDHRQIFLGIRNTWHEKKQKIRYSAIDYKKLYKLTEYIPYEGTNCYDMLESYIQKNIEKCKVTKTKILNKPQQEWINKDIVEEIRNRNKMWKLLKYNKTDEHVRNKFIAQRNKVTALIRKTKKKYYYNEFTKQMKNPKKMWKLISEMATNKTRMNYIPNKLTIDHVTLTSEQDICEAFNSYFATIGTNLANMLPQTSSANLISLQTNPQNKQTLSKLQPCTHSEIGNIIDHLKSNVSTGMDQISVKSIKCIKHLVIGNLVNCIDDCLSKGVFPDSLKLAKVTPIHKSGSKSDPNNFRPISVLPICSKIFEKVIYKRLDTYLTSIEYLCPNQYGFRPKSNTMTATIDLTTDIKRHIDQREIALGIFIDLKKAFDTVSHDILLWKLGNIGLTGVALDMFKSYLTNRHQLTRIGISESSKHAINCGIPQGSILGPLLFLIYVNDITDLKLYGNITLYADDTSLFYYGLSISDIIKQAQTDLDTLSKWFINNLLTINTNKTNYIIFTNKNKSIGNYNPLTINGEQINITDKEKYLGLILDKGLTWHPHIENVKLKITPLAGALRRIANNLPLKIKYTLYNTLVKPHLDYLVTVWGTAASRKIQELQATQNRIVKALFQYNYWTPTATLYKDTNIMNVRQLYKYHTCLLIRKIMRRETHTKITFVCNHQVRNYNLRRASYISTRSINPRTAHGKKTIIFEGVNLFNKIPKDIRSMQSTILFKKCLRGYISKGQ